MIVCFFFLSVKCRQLFAKKEGHREGRKADKEGNRGTKIDFYFRTWPG